MQTATTTLAPPAQHAGGRMLGALAIITGLVAATVVVLFDGLAAVSYGCPSGAVDPFGLLS